MKPYIKITLFVVFFLALAAIGVSLYLYNLKPKDLAKVKPDYVITSDDLLKPFEENEAQANSKYINKIIEVEGTVGSIVAGENNSINVSIKTYSDFSSVICSFSSKDDIDGLKAGTLVTVRGECSGYLMDVLLKNCALVKGK